MTEINLILNLDLELDNNDRNLHNDKEILFENLNSELHIYTYNSYKYYNINYNHILNNFLYNDNYLDEFNNNYNLDSTINKLIIKKLLHYYQPIIKIDNLQLLSNYKSNIIVDSNSIQVNYPIQAQFIDQSNKYYNIRLPSNYNFKLSGLFNYNYFNYNLPYKLNKYLYFDTNIIKSFNNKININNSKFKYFNKKLFVLNNDIKPYLINLYYDYLNYYQIFINNNFLYNNLNPSYNNDIVVFNNNLLDYSKFDSKLVKNNNLIKFCNDFLDYKINNQFNNHIYFAFEANNLLNLYEKMLLYSIDDKHVKVELNNISNHKEHKLEYLKGQKIINEYNLKKIELELITKKKFPNLFNPSSKEVIFNNLNPFSFNDLPKKYKDIIIIEYNKLQTYKKNYKINKCIHKQLIKNLFLSNNKFNIIQDIKKLINNSNNNDYYKCKLCSYNLICPHIIDYYSLLFTKNDNDITEFSVRQRIINKYMSNSKINMIYYCKICGEELGKSLDLDQNIEYKDNIKLNTSEYTDETLELIKSTISYIVYSYVIISEFNLNITKKFIIDFITNTISNYINSIEKSLRKTKLYNEENIMDLLKFNSIIFTYSTLIYIMTKHSTINFSNNFNKSNIITKKIKSNIITKKISGSKQNNKELVNIIKNRFKNAYDLILSTNNILINKLKFNKNLESIKELLVKTYGIIAKNEQINIVSTQKNLTYKLENLLNSNILKYYDLIFKIYPLTSKLSTHNSYFSFNKNNYQSSYNTHKYEYDKILNKDLKHLNKIDNLFDSIKSKIIIELDNLFKINSINTYEDYKILSFNLFHIYNKYELYNLPIFYVLSTLNSVKYTYKKYILDNVYLVYNNSNNSINSNNSNNSNNNSNDIIIYQKYLYILEKLKLYEIHLINENLKYFLYPYSWIKLNNSRYFYSINFDLNVFFCPKDGKFHNYNIYIYQDSNQKLLEINKYNLDKFITNNDNYNKFKFINYKCSKCNYTKFNSNNTKNNTSKNIKNIIQEQNDINGFFNLYLKICPIKNKNNHYQFHNFNINKSPITCSICNIKYDDLINKNYDIFTKYYSNYIAYNNDKINIINNKLLSFNKSNKELNNFNIINYYNNQNNYINTINKLNLDNIIVQLSKTFKIDIIYLQNLGLTEGINYNQINSINYDFSNISNRLNKLYTYFRTILIYYNLLKHNKSINSYYDSDFNSILENIKDLNYKLLKILPDFNINLSNLLIYCKLHFDNQNIISFYLKVIYNFILELDNINKQKLNNQLNNFINFIIFKILKFDELFSNYNYSQLKQMFIEDKFDIDFNNEIYEDDNNTEENELFEYNDLNINFDDEDPIE